MIRIPQVRVVDEEGAQLGVMPTPRELEMAQERGLDLVEVAPMASPPVVKFLDFGQYKYELTKREKEAKRKQRSVTFKEVRLSPKIGVGDFDTKVHRAIEFLEDGDRIKVTVRFRGRELTHPELGRNLIARFADRVKDHGVAERTPLLEGKSMHITMASIHKPKGHDAPAARTHDGAEAREETGAPAPAPVATTQAATRATASEAPAAATETAAPTASTATTAIATPTATAATTATATPTATRAVAAPRAAAAKPAPAPATEARLPVRAAASAASAPSKVAAPQKTATEPKATNDKTPAPEPVRTGE
jgi:translation initiation factor IF-3